MNDFDKTIVEPLNKKIIGEFNEFSNVHWGEHSGDPGNDFFATPTFASVVKENDDLIALMFVFIRDFVLEKNSISFGAIGGVVTHTDYRHKGIATDLVSFTLNELTNRDIDISILCTDISRLGKLYKSCGFSVLESRYTYINLFGEKVEEVEGMIAPCASKEKYDLVLNSKEEIFLGISNY
jgi:predicted GNAT family N-acyltransferase